MASKKEQLQEQRNHNRIKFSNDIICQQAKKRYESNIETKRDSWMNCSPDFLVARLVQELGEFLEHPDYDEAGDCVALMSMILNRV